MHITNEMLQNYKVQVQKVYGKYMKKLKISKICGIIGPAVFLLISMVISYCGLLFYDRTAVLKEQALTKLAPINNFFEPIMKFLQFGAKPWYIVLPICLAVVLLIPFLVNVIIAIIVNYAVEEKEIPDSSEQPIKRIKSLIEFAELSNRYILNPFENSCSLISWLYVLFIAGIFVYIYIQLKFAASFIASVIIGFVFAALIIFFLYRVLFTIFGGLSGMLLKNNNKSIPDLVKNMKNDLSKEQYLINEEKARKEKEKMRKAAAKEREEAAARRKEGNELYAQATSGDEFDEALIKKAADMGSPDACLYHGRKLMKQWSSEPLTRAEKVDLTKVAALYLATAAAHSAEGKFLWILARTQYEKNDSSEWNDMLRNVREIKNSGELPEEYDETCEILLQTLVDVIDSLSKSSKSTSNTVNKEPKIKSVYCKFNNAGICNRLSTSYSIYHCNYMNNPGGCSTCLNNNGYGVEFE